MIGDFPIQFSIYTNCSLHHVFLAWEACGIFSTKFESTETDAVTTSFPGSKEDPGNEVGAVTQRINKQLWHEL